MRLEVDRAAGSSVSDRYTQTAAAQFGQLMEVLGIRLMRVSLARGAAATVAFADSVRAFDFAPPDIVAIAVSAAPDLARAMAAAGIVRLEISSVSDSERESLESSWRSASGGAARDSVPVPPPEIVPDMRPVEVDL
jgi:hypothetical protein